MRPFVKELIFLLPFFILVLPLYGQHQQPMRVSVEQFSLEHGLSNRDVNHFAKDKQGFVWVATYNGLSRFDGYSFLNFDSRPQNSYKIRFNKIEYLYVDRNGNLILYSDTGKSGVFDMLNPLTGDLTTLHFEACRGKLITLYTAPDGMLYFLILDGNHHVLYHYDDERQELVKEFVVEASLVVENYPAGVFKSAKGHFWVAVLTEGGLKVVQTDGSGRTLNTYAIDGDFSIPAGDSTKFRLAETADGQIWLATGTTGVYILEPSKESKFKLHRRLQGGDYMLEADAKGNYLVYQNRPTEPSKGCFLITADGRLVDYSFVLEHQSIIDPVYSEDFTQWLMAGSLNGFNKYQLQPPYFETFLAKELGNEPFGISTRGMAKLGPDKLYISTESEGLYELDVRTGKLSKPGNRLPQLEPLNSHKYTRTLLAEGDSTLWMAVMYGVVKYQPKTNRCDFYPVPGNEIWGLAFGKDRYLWALPYKGMLVRMDPHTGACSQYLNNDGSNPLEGTFATYLLTGKDGTLWVGTSFLGLINIDTETGEVRRFTANPGDPAGFKSNHITCIYEDGDGLLWVGTLESGLHHFDPVKGKVTAVYTREDGLGHQSVASILPDQQGNLWVSTFNGLSFFDVKKKTFNNYTMADGLSYNEFNRHSSFYDKENKRFYFGGMNGVNAFYENDLRPAENHAPLLISEVSYQNASDSTVKIFTGIGDGSTLSLPPGNGSIYIRLALASYGSSPKNLFSYNIEELNDQWIPLGTDTELRLNQLPAGSYTLHLRGADNRGNWSSKEITLQIVVLEYWYKRWWAWLLYFGLIAMSGFYYYRSQLKKRIAEKEAHRLQELDTFKSRLFTNISHEFRTPLTVILGTVGQLQNAQINENETAYNLIRRNGEGLLRLVNQILDLSKMEGNTLNMQYQQSDVLPYLRYTTESMHSLANVQGVALTVKMPEGELVMDYDPDRLLQIVYNLVSNAVKFTLEGGKVRLQVEVSPQQSELIIAVADTGVGIPPSDLHCIFDRFYQAENLEKAQTGGTGIGLALTKELVQIMGGTIAVESAPGNGATFTVVLPITRNAPVVEGQSWLFSENVPTEKAKVQGKPARQRKDLPLVLVIEDSPDVAAYIVACLHERYRLEVAYNGDKGLEMALDMVPDLIVSDVMLPGKDGFELCDLLKKDVRTSHIPLVLLTARADQESRLSGLRRGADVYLAKPFFQEELILVLQNLLKLRQQIQEKFSVVILNVSVDPADPLETSDFEMEHQFVQQVRAAVEANIGDPAFTVQKLCQKLAMSQPQVHRKLTALTGKNATQFIRSIRLVRAKVLLEQKGKSVSEVAYEVGFDDPKYFSRVFSETFGIAPSKV